MTNPSAMQRTGFSETLALATAKSVLEHEIKGLEAVKAEFGSPFLNALAILLAASGRIIVTGMGKSGHIARKIAATFASTGTPALYVHPGEASHGDLGMIARDDVVLALSKSGETGELQDLLAYTRRFSIPLCAITAGQDSALARAADTVLLLPNVPEACDVTRAPTTSTTMMLALGDALSVALLQAKGLTTSDFQGFHPGGILGAALRRVEDLMHSHTSEQPLPLCSHNQTTAGAIDVLHKGGFGCVGIINEHGHLIGMLTDGDVRRLFGRDEKLSEITKTMTPDPKTVAPSTIAGDALAIMSKDKITSLFVVEDNKPVGLLHIHDCLASGVL